MLTEQGFEIFAECQDFKVLLTTLQEHALSYWNELADKTDFPLSEAYAVAYYRAKWICSRQEARRRGGITRAKQTLQDRLARDEQIRTLHAQGMSVNKIRKTLQVRAETVKKALP